MCHGNETVSLGMHCEWKKGAHFVVQFQMTIMTNLFSAGSRFSLPRASLRHCAIILNFSITKVVSTKYMAENSCGIA